MWLRLHHLYAVDEDPLLSVNVTIDIADLFVGMIPLKMTEMTLTANRPLDELHRLQWIVESAEKDVPMEKSVEGWKVTIAPMEIRTFLVQMKYIK